MKWLEIIEIRFFNRNHQVIESQIQQWLDDIGTDLKQPAIKMYRRDALDTDLSIHLQHDSKDVETGGSRLGGRLCALLKEFGMVNHRIWIETLIT